MFKWMIAILLGSTACVASPAQAQWYAGVDFMVPTRNSTSNTIFQRGQTSTARVSSEVLLGEQRDLDLHFAAAGRVTVGNRSGIFGLEGSYMATTDWTHTASVFDGSGRLVSPFSLVGATLNLDVDNNTSAVVDYTTQLNTAEFNLTQRVYVGGNGSASLLYGARYMSIEESLNYASSNANPLNLLITTDNQLVGPQLGVLIESPLGGGTLNLAFKSALAYNTIDKTTVFDGTLGATVFTGTLGQGSDTDASLMSEIDVHYIFFPTANLSVRLGYQFLGATDVALATKNFERNLSVVTSGLANVQSDSGVAYHSPYVGVIFAY